MRGSTSTWTPPAVAFGSGVAPTRRLGLVLPAGAFVLKTRLPRWLGLVCLAWWLGCASLGAQGFHRTLQDVKVFSGGALESVQFTFSTPYEGSPKVTVRGDRLVLNFSSVGSTAPRRQFRVNDSELLRELEIVQNRFSTTTTLWLRQADPQLERRLRFENRGRILEMVIHSNARPPPPVSDRSLRADLERIIAAGNQAREVAEGTTASATAPAPRSDLPLGQTGSGVESWGQTFLVMLIALAIMLGGLYLLLRVYRRVAGRMPQRQGRLAMRVLAAHPVGPRQRVVVIDVGGEQLVCGVTPQSISLLLHLSAVGGASRRGVPSAAGTRAERSSPPTAEARNAETRNAEARTTEARRTRRGAARPGRPGGAVQEETLRAFSEVLKRKTRNLPDP